MDIPKIIWQTWKNTDIPPLLSRCIQSFHTLNSDWTQHLATDEEIESFIIEHFPEQKDALLRYPPGILRADIWRVLVLYRFGGVYADIDIECIQPLDDLIVAARAEGLIHDDTEIILTRDHNIHEREYYGNQAIYMNHFFMAKPGSQFLKRYIEGVCSYSDNEIASRANDPVMLTGPGVFTQVFHELQQESNLHVGVLPRNWIHPLPDLARHYPEKEGYDTLIRRGDWTWEVSPYTAHYWWHNYAGCDSTLDIYGDLLFQRKELILSRWLDHYLGTTSEQSSSRKSALHTFSKSGSQIVLEVISGDVSDNANDSDTITPLTDLLQRLNYSHHLEIASGTLPAIPENVALCRLGKGLFTAFPLAVLHEFMANILDTKTMVPGGIVMIEDFTSLESFMEASGLEQNLHLTDFTTLPTDHHLVLQRHASDAEPLEVQQSSPSPHDTHDTLISIGRYEGNGSSEHWGESRSQLGQDRFVYDVLKKTDGYFVEFGASDGAELSNTLKLEQMGWTGIVAEPARMWHDGLHQNRRCHISTDCVWSCSNQEIQFCETPDGGLSSAVKYATSDHWDRSAGIIYNVNTISLLDLLQKFQAPKIIDYLSIDTEGSELEILEAFDFSAYTILIITAEHNWTSNREPICELLTRNNFTRVLGVDCDDWYLHNSIKHLWKQP